MTKLKVGLTTGAAAVVLASVIGIGAVSANGQTDDTLADKIASAFHLNKDDVQKVIDQNRSAHKAQHEQKYEERLNQAVTDGKLTADQKDKILTKHKELEASMQAERDSLKDKTKADRRAAMEQKKAEITQWEKDNNIPSGYLGMGAHGHGGHRPGPDARLIIK